MTIANNFSELIQDANVAHEQRFHRAAKFLKKRLLVSEADQRPLRT
jgi:hypothetical protein